MRLGRAYADPEAAFNAPALELDAQERAEEPNFVLLDISRATPSPDSCSVARMSMSPFPK